MSLLRIVPVTMVSGPYTSSAPSFRMGRGDMMAGRRFPETCASSPARSLGSSFADWRSIRPCAGHRRDGARASHPCETP